MPTYTDNFNRANASTLGTIPGSSLTWQVVSGTWSISSNKPYTNTSPSSNPIAVVDTNNPDTEVSVTANGGDALYVRVVNATNWIRLRVDRYSVVTSTYTQYEWKRQYLHDGNAANHSSVGVPTPEFADGYGWGNSSTTPPDPSAFAPTITLNHTHYTATGFSHTHTYYLVSGTVTYTGNTRQVNTSSPRYRLRLEKCVNGSVTVLDSYEYSTSAPGTIRLRAIGSTLEGFWKGEATPVVTVTDGTHASATRHGIGRGPTSVNSQQLDDFSVDTLNTAPNAPTLVAPANGAALNRAQDQTFEWQFNDPDPGDSQSAYNHAYRPVGGEWIETGWITSTISRLVIPGGTFAPGDYEWQVFTKDSRGLPSPPSATSFFTAGDTPPGPSITDPANNQTITEPEYLVVWSTPDQDAYRLRVLDADGVAVYDSGQVDSPTERSRIVALPDTDVQRTIEVTIFDGLLWSLPAVVTVTVSLTPPPVPEVLVDNTSTAGAIRVASRHPTPSGDQPSVTHFDVYRRAGSEVDGIRVAKDVAPSRVFIDYFVASGVDYDYRVRAYGENGASAWSEWSGEPELIYEDMDGGTPFTGDVEYLDGGSI